MKIKYKNIKKCFMISASLKKEYGVIPGKILQVKSEKIFFLNAVSNNNEIQYFSTPETIVKDTLLLFIDIVFLPEMSNHYLRFLSGDKILYYRWTKKFTHRIIPKIFKIQNTLINNVR